MSVTPGSSIPTLQEELDRKVMDALEWIQDSVAGARMSDAQAAVAVDALFKAVSGLVDNQFIDIITHMGILYAGSPKLTRVLIKDDKIVKIDWAIGTSSIDITAYIAGEKSTWRTQDYDTPAEAKAAGDKAIAKLKTAGYTQL